MGGKTGPHTVQRLSAVKVERLKEPGMYPDGKGLYFRIKPTGSKGWILRYQLDGRRRDMGLGSYPDVSLAEARKKAEEARKARHDGRDPLEARKAERQLRGSPRPGR